MEESRGSIMHNKHAKTSALCSAYAKDVSLYYGMDVKKRHSRTVCQSCYRRLKKMNKPSETMLKNVRSDIESCNHGHAEYDSTPNVRECTVCSYFQEQCKGSFQIGKRGERRPVGQRQGSESDNGQTVMPTTSIEDQPKFLVPLIILGMLHLQCANAMSTIYGE